ncbi:MAG TPA: hypothetical protein VK167_12975 [Flavipsychrobacter sp.]|nr:hypothetical protein [Flavipsychrobacter sp.]
MNSKMCCGTHCTWQSFYINEQTPSTLTGNAYSTYEQVLRALPFSFADTD